MYITSLNEMENIVKSNNSLVWSENFTVLEVEQSDDAMYDPLGVRINDVWYIKRNVFELEPEGWHLPERISNVAE